MELYIFIIPQLPSQGTAKGSFSIRVKLPPAAYRTLWRLKSPPLFTMNVKQENRVNTNFSIFWFNPTKIELDSTALVTAAHYTRSLIG